MIEGAGRWGLRRLRAAVLDWPIWSLPRWVICFVLAVIAAEAAAIGVAASLTHFQPHGAGVFLALMLFAAISLELARRYGEAAGFVKVTYTVWNLAIAILLPPVYALVAPIIWQTLNQSRIRRGLLYRRCFTAAAVGLSYGAASVVFHAILPGTGWRSPGLSVHALTWVGVVMVSGVIQWAVNTTLVVTPVMGSDPTANLRQMMFNAEGMFNDLAEFSTALVFTFIAASNVLLVLVTLPFVILLQRSSRHAELTNASRIDAKTGLLNATTWQREAEVQVARAVRTRTPLAVAMLDLDHFKAVNDTHGHLTGDLALSAVSDVLRSGLRDYDVAGRFGGEEFSVLLPHTAGAEASAIAERLREQVAALIIPARTSGDQPLRLTVSIGVAAISGSRRDVDDLLAAADHALYQAKRSGRNMVCVVSDSPGDQETIVPAQAVRAGSPAPNRPGSARTTPA